MQCINKFKILDGDTVIFEGTSHEVADKFGFRPKDIGTYANNHSKLLGKYIVVSDGKVRKTKAESIYGLFLNNELVDKGTCDELIKKYGTTRNSLIGKAYTDGLYLNKYAVRTIGRTDNNIDLKRTQSSKHQANLEYLIKHLRKYGNTCFNGKVEDYIEELKEVGLEPRIRQVVSRNMAGRKEKWWVLEL